MSQPKQNKSRARSVSIPDDIFDRVQDLATLLGLSQSATLTMFLRKYLPAFEEDVNTLVKHVDR